DRVRKEGKKERKKESERARASERAEFPFRAVHVRPSVTQRPLGKAKRLPVMSLPIGEQAPFSAHAISPGLTHSSLMPHQKHTHSHTHTHTHTHTLTLSEYSHTHTHTHTYTHTHTHPQ